MISFEREFNRFRIKLTGDRQRMYADDVAGMKLAVEHYYSPGHGKKEPSCPLCIAGDVAAKKLNRRQKS